jgi:hypothetical protein
MNNPLQSHLLTLKNNIFIVGISFMLGLCMNTVLSFYINSKLNYIINDNNTKHVTLIKELEKMKSQISILDYERDKLLNEIISFKTVKCDEPFGNLT